MVKDSNKLKAIISFKEKLEKRIQELQAEIEESKSILETMNSLLLEKGFKRGDIKEIESPKGETQPAVEVIFKEKKAAESQAIESESVIPLRTKNKETLAIIYVDKQVLHILPDESKRFRVSTPPFTSFLVERVLLKMKEKDSELARTGQLALNKTFTYDIIREGDLIREILIRNVDDDRLRELKSSVRWTLEKMYEKTQS
jgi:hypothetical protein